MDIYLKQIENLLEEDDKLAAIANAIAFINENLNDINWVGLYLYKRNMLILGPFQGKVACTKIPLDKGVCGAAFSKNKVLNVKDVHEFKGHIACDCASNSELVIPLNYKNQLYGVLDIDSPLFNRFSEKDEKIYLEVAKLIAMRLAKDDEFTI